MVLQRRAPRRTALARVKGETVRFAHQEHFPPFVDVQNGTSEGLLAEVLLAAATQAGIEAEFVPVPFAQVQQTLDDGRAEAIFPMAITPERLKLFDFSSPLLTTGGALYVRAPDATPEGLAALSGKIVVTPRSGPLAAIIQNAAPTINLVITADYEDSLNRLISGEADAAALNFQVGARLAAKLYPGRVTKPRTMFAQQLLAIGVRKGRSDELLIWLNAGLAVIKADGTWQQINTRWAEE